MTGVNSDRKTLAEQSRDSITLQPWEEVTGELNDLTVEERRLVVELSVGRLAYPIGSPSATILEEELAGCVGKRVGILCRPDHQRPLAVDVKK